MNAHSQTNFSKRLETALFAPINLAPLIFFRVLFGGIMLWEVMRYYDYNWIERYYIDPEFFFTYYGLGWVAPWPGNLMSVHFLVLGILATFIMLGLWYRISAVLFFLGFTYVFLLDQTNYLNHFYLISLVSFVMIFVPAHRGASLDIVRQPDLHAETGPAWPLYLLCTQIGISYFFGGIAKINGDWLQGEPMRMWLADRTDFPVFGRYFEEPWAPYLFSYGGLLLDLCIVPLLLWKRTRMVAYFLTFGFHITNDHLFSIGIFPWFMMGATALFFDPDQFVFFRRYVERVISKTIKYTKTSVHTSDPHKRLIVKLLALYMGFQILMPFRHHLYPGNVSWTEEGHYFAWHMKLRSKSGTLDLIATDPNTGESWTVDQRDFLTSRQRSKMEGHPDMIVQFCHYLEQVYRKKGHADVEIRAVAKISLNGREPQLMIDPTVDLTSVKRSLFSATYILPLLEGVSPKDHRS